MKPGIFERILIWLFWEQFHRFALGILSEAYIGGIITQKQFLLMGHISVRKVSWWPIIGEIPRRERRQAP